MILKFVSTKAAHSKYTSNTCVDQSNGGGEDGQDLPQMPIPHPSQNIFVAMPALPVLRMLQPEPNLVPILQFNGLQCAQNRGQRDRIQL